MLKKVFFCPKCSNCVTPLARYKRGGEGVWIFEIFEKMRGSDFSHKNGVVGEIGKEGGRGYHYFHTN